MTIAVDVTYAVLAHDISPDRRIRVSSCIKISSNNYGTFIDCLTLSKHGFVCSHYTVIRHCHTIVMQQITGCSIRFKLGFQK